LDRPIAEVMTMAYDEVLAARIRVGEEDAHAA
jgi:hypothetical protein